MIRQQLIDRLKWYYPLERTHAFLTFPAMIVYMAFHHPFTDILFLVYGLLVCILILIQGQHYWKLKLYRLTGKPFDQGYHIGLFQKARKVNLVFIGLIPVMFIIQLYFNQWSIPTGELFIWALVANCFAILEHINYYNIQLMIDNMSDVQYVLRNKRFKTASLKKDLMDGEI